MQSEFQQHQNIETYRQWEVRELNRLPKKRKAAIANSVTQTAIVSLAEEQSRKLRIDAEHQLPLQRFMKPLLSSVIAIGGALICSASAQAFTIPLPRTLRIVATPLIAAMFVVGTEKVSSSALNQLRLKQRYELERARRQLCLASVSKDRPLEKTYQQAQLELLDVVESRPWPALELRSIGLISVIEVGATFWFVSQEGILIAIFASAAPLAYVLMASLILTKMFGNRDALLQMAETYEGYLVPQAVPPELTYLPDEKVSAFKNELSQPWDVEVPTDDVPEAASTASSNGHVALPNIVFPGSVSDSFPSS